MPDHSTITLQLKSEILSQPKGHGFWKLNNSLLEDCDYVDKLREEIPLFENKYSDVQNLSLKWDLIKMEIRGFTIKFSKIKAKRRRNEESILQNKANQLLEQTEKTPSDKKLLNELLRHHSTLTNTNASKDKRSNPQKQSQVARARIAQ